MPFEIVRNDIVNLQVDAVVNSANPNPVVGAGVDSVIHKKAGYKLLEERQKIGCIEVGDAAILRAMEWMQSMLSIQLVRFGKMAAIMKRRFLSHVTGSHWNWQKSMGASLSPFL